MSYPSYPARWNDPAFADIACYLVQQKVKMPYLVKIGLIREDERQMFAKFINAKALEPGRGRASQTLDLKDKALRTELTTALNIYNRQALGLAVADGDLARAIVKAYKYFNQLVRTPGGNKLTLERFIIAVIDEEYSDIALEDCGDCGCKYIAWGGSNLEPYSCTLCKFNFPTLIAHQQEDRAYQMLAK